jgi:hypothetical protein
MIGRVASTHEGEKAISETAAMTSAPTRCVERITVITSTAGTASGKAMGSGSRQRRGH